MIKYLFLTVRNDREYRTVFTLAKEELQLYQSAKLTGNEYAEQLRDSIPPEAHANALDRLAQADATAFAAHACLGRETKEG